MAYRNNMDEEKQVEDVAACDKRLSHLETWKARLLHASIALSLFLFIYLSFELIETKNFITAQELETSSKFEQSLIQDEILIGGDFAYMDSVPTNIREANQIEDVFAKVESTVTKLAEKVKNANIIRDVQTKVTNTEPNPETIVYEDEDDYPHLAHNVKAAPKQVI